jgi:putative transposase
MEITVGETHGQQNQQKPQPRRVLNKIIDDFIRDIKTSTSSWLKTTGKYPGFQGWAEGYAALTYAWQDKQRIVVYIMNQQDHHKKLSFEEELRTLLLEHGININENFFL